MTTESPALAPASSCERVASVLVAVTSYFCVPLTGAPLATAPASVRSSLVAALFSVPVPFTLKLSRPRVLALISCRSMSMVSPSFAPTCTVSLPASADRTFTPLNCVCSETRLISSRRWVISAWIESRSLAEFVPLAACTDSSRMRCRLLFTSVRAPSVV
ncbi:hypothetical protein D9M68_614900 [compost metagenome]